MTSQREGGPSVRGNVNRVPVVLQTWGCSRCDREWNGYSSKVKDFKDLGIKIKMILIIKTG
jgi:hypothetical protein